MTGKYPYNAFLRQLHSSKVAGQQGQPRQLLSANQAVVLGRDPSCEIVLDATVYEGVSRRHAEVRPLPGVQSQGVPVWQICDLNSANGTYVNRLRLHGCQTLQVGDRIRLDLNGPEFIFECQVNTPVVHAPKALPLQQSDSVHLSQLLPIFSTRRDLTKKVYLLPGIVTVLFTLALLITKGTPFAFDLLLSAYIAGGNFYFIYQLCGKFKPWWITLGSALVTILLLLPFIRYQSGPFTVFEFVFYRILPGRLSQEGKSFPAVLVGSFFGPGLSEELFKAIPVLAAYLLGRRLRSPWRERVGVWEPLDGILLGVASALGFTLVETLGEYVPKTIIETANQAGVGAGHLAGLQLLIPRILGEVFGHMAYSGCLGYSIGLSALKPAKRWRILGVGYLIAASLHGLWDSIGFSVKLGFSPILSILGLLVVGAVSYAFLMAAILKARKLSPNRSQNFATHIAGPRNFP